MISIVLRTKNEEKYIERCLESIFNQKIEDKFEVIIVDAGSTDQTLQRAKKYPISIVNVPPALFSYGKSLNLGVKNASGQSIVFLSAHALPASDEWLSNLTGELKLSDVGAVYGKQEPFPNCNPLETRDLIQDFGDQKMIQSDCGKFSNANSAVKRKLLLEEPFREDIAFAEDKEWAERITKKYVFSTPAS